MLLPCIPERFRGIWKHDWPCWVSTPSYLLGSLVSEARGGGGGREGAEGKEALLEPVPTLPI